MERQKSTHPLKHTCPLPLRFLSLNHVFVILVIFFFHFLSYRKLFFPTNLVSCFPDILITLLNFQSLFIKDLKEIEKFSWTIYRTASRSCVQTLYVQTGNLLPRQYLVFSHVFFTSIECSLSSLRSILRYNCL